MSRFKPRRVKVPAPRVQVMDLDGIDPEKLEAAWNRHVSIVDGNVRVDIEEFCVAIGLDPTQDVMQSVVFQLSAAFGHPVITEVGGGPFHKVQ